MINSQSSTNTAIEAVCYNPSTAYAVPLPLHKGGNALVFISSSNSPTNSNLSVVNKLSSLKLYLHYNTTCDTIIV